MWPWWDINLYSGNIFKLELLFSFDDQIITFGPNDNNDDNDNDNDDRNTVKVFVRQMINFDW